MRSSLETFQAYQTSCSKIGFELDLAIHLKNLVTHATCQSRFLTVAGLKLDQLRSGWDAGCQGLDFALNLLRSNTGISSPALLASPFLLISLGFYGAQRHYGLSPDEAAGLVRWVLGVARQCQGPLQPQLQRNPARSRPQNHPRRWQLSGVARAPANPGGPP